MAEKSSLIKMFDGYVCKEKAAEDASEALLSFNKLKPQRKPFIYNNGDTRVLVQLEGTIPITYKSVIYQAPIAIILQETHPKNPPIVYVRPTSSMFIRDGPFVTAQGLVTVPYLFEWQQDVSDITTLISVLCIQFSEIPPMFAKPAKPLMATSVASKHPPKETFSQKLTSIGKVFGKVTTPNRQQQAASPIIYPSYSNLQKKVGTTPPIHQQPAASPIVYPSYSIHHMEAGTAPPGQFLDHNTAQQKLTRSDQIGNKSHYSCDAPPVQKKQSKPNASIIDLPVGTATQNIPSDGKLYYGKVTTQKSSGQHSTTASASSYPSYSQERIQLEAALSTPGPSYLTNHNSQLKQAEQHPLSNHLLSDIDDSTYTRKQPGKDHILDQAHSFHGGVLKPMKSDELASANDPIVQPHYGDASHALCTARHEAELDQPNVKMLIPTPKLDEVPTDPDNLFDELIDMLPAVTSLEPKILTMKSEIATSNQARESKTIVKNTQSLEVKPKHQSTLFKQLGNNNPTQIDRDVTPKMDTPPTLPDTVYQPPTQPMNNSDKEQVVIVGNSNIECFSVREPVEEHPCADQMICRNKTSDKNKAHSMEDNKTPGDDSLPCPLSLSSGSDIMMGSNNSLPSTNENETSLEEVECWEVDDVCRWLDTIGLSDHKVSFADNNITGDTLSIMSKDDMKEMGVTKVGDRLKLQKEINKLLVNVGNPKSAATPDNVSHQVSITETASNFTDNKYGYMEASSDGFPSIEPITDDFKLIGPDGEEMESHQPISILENREEEPMSFVVISEDDGDDHEVDDYDSYDKSLSIDSLINSSWSIPDDTGG